VGVIERRGCARLAPEAGNRVRVQRARRQQLDRDRPSEAGISGARIQVDLARNCAALNWRRRCDLPSVSIER
jgi:hypothetical protein